MSRCDGCGGEDCACCEVYLEQMADQRYELEEDADDYNFYRQYEDDEPEYLDTETDEVLTLDELKAEYKKLRAAGETEAESFEDYLSNCLEGNGTLERL